MGTTPATAERCGGVLPCREPRGSHGVGVKPLPLPSITLGLDIGHNSNTLFVRRVVRPPGIRSPCPVWIPLFIVLLAIRRYPGRRGIEIHGEPQNPYLSPDPIRGRSLGPEKWIWTNASSRLASKPTTVKVRASLGGEANHPIST